MIDVPWFAQTTAGFTMLLLSAALIAGAVVDRLLRRDAEERNLVLQEVHAAAFELLMLKDGVGMAARVEEALSRIAVVIGAECIWIELGSGSEDVLCWSRSHRPSREEASAFAGRMTRRFPWSADAILVAPGERFAFSLRSIAARRRATPLSALLLRSGDEGEAALLCVRAVAGPLLIRSEAVSGLAAALLIAVQLERRRRLEAQRLTLERKLALGRRMESVGALASGIAHNLNNMFNAIEGFAATAAPHASKGIVSASLEGIGQATARGSALVADMLRFGRRLEGPPELVVVHELLEETRKLLSASLPTSIKLIVDEGEDHRLRVVGDFGELQQVLLNLCSNAAKAMPGGGQILCRASSRLLDDPIRLSHGVLRRGLYATIVVSDGGHGIDERTIPLLFDAFYTTHADGTGLGLSTAREIVERHRGEIDVDSVKGEGSSFTVWLPMAGEPAKVSSEPHVERGAGEIVMLINPDPRRLMDDEELLAALGYEPIGVVADDPLEIDEYLGAADVIVVAGLDPLLAERLAAVARRSNIGAPVLVAVPQPRCRASTLRYPFRPAALAHALARCLDRGETPEVHDLRAAERRGDHDDAPTCLPCRSDRALS